MPVAVDTETSRPSRLEPVPRLVSIAIPGHLYHHTNPHAVEVVRWALSQGAIFARAPFDVTALLRWNESLLPDIVSAYAAGRVYDVITRGKIIEGALGIRSDANLYNLGALAKKWAGMEVDKQDPWRTRYVELYRIPVEYWAQVVTPDGLRGVDAIAYAMRDAYATQAVFEAQEQYRHLLGTQALTARAHLALYEQTLRGIETDQQQVARVRYRLMTEIHALDQELMPQDLVRVSRLHPTKIKPTTNKKAAQAILEQIDAAAGGNVFARTPTGLVQMTDDALDQALHKLRMRKAGEESIALLRKLIHRRALAAQITKNVSKMESDEVRKAVVRLEKSGKPCPPDWPERLPKSYPHVVRTSYDEMKVTARTGAASPSKGGRDSLGPEDWVGDNYQNQPRTGGFRECLRARKGYKFVVADWGGAELVALAQTQLDVVGRSTLAEALRAGRNPHDIQAAVLLGIPYEQFDKRIPEHKDRRQLSKALNFGYPADMGPKRFIDYARASYGLDISLAEARQGKRIWKATWPEIVPYQKWCTSVRVPCPHCQGVGCKWCSFGKQPYYQVNLPRAPLQRTCKYTDANNFPFQGLTALAAKDVLWTLWCEMRAGGALSGAHQVLFVHDENVLEVLEGLADPVGQALERLMVEGFGRWCPDVPIEVEWSISERYGK